MARKTARPGRTLGVFFLGLAIAFGLVALAGNWKPELGLDLQGGTSIRLTPKGDPSTESLNEARKIIDQRVNGSGVAEAEVTVQGNRFIVVEIPGQSRRDLVDTVKRQAQLRFRIVACSDFNPGAVRRPAPTHPAGPDRSRTTTRAPASTARRPATTAPPTPSDAAAVDAAPTDAASPSGTANRAPVTTPTRPAPRRRRPSDSAATDRVGQPERRQSTAPSDGATPPSDPAIPVPRGRPRRRRPAEVDRRAQPGGDRRLQRVHLPARTARRSTSRTTRRSRWSPASGTPRTRSPPSTCSPPR